MVHALLADATQGQVPWANYGLAGLLFSVLLYAGARLYRDKQKEIADLRAEFERRIAEFRADRDNAQAEVRRLNGVIQDKYVPALEETRQALLDSHELTVLLRAELRNR